MRPMASSVIACLLLCACTGTRTGNPADGGDAPKGAVLVRSELSREADPPADPARDRKLAAGNRAFACELYRTLSKDDANLFLSPYSVSSALAMTYAGAAGETESQLASALHFELPQAELHAAFNHASSELEGRKDEIMPKASGDGFELHVVNQAWGQKDHPFLDSYLDVLGVNYGAGLFLLDFHKPEPARQIINGWVLEQTHDRIADLLPEGSLSTLTKLVLTNAVYFKASWLNAFDPAKTQEASFHAPGGVRSVQMMQRDQVRYTAGTDYEAVSLPYLAPDVSMILILPAEGRFAAVRDGLDGGFIDRVSDDLNGIATVLRVPRFRFESENRLKQPLQALGARAVFGADSADLSRMDGKPHDLYVEEVFHKAFVAVDEQGTEAAASTAVVLRTRGVVPPHEITFDRPFIFAILDQPTGQILFIGQLVDPG